VSAVIMLLAEQERIPTLTAKRSVQTQRYIGEITEGARLRLRDWAEFHDATLTAEERAAPWPRALAAPATIPTSPPASPDPDAAPSRKAGRDTTTMSAGDTQRHGSAGPAPPPPPSDPAAAGAARAQQPAALTPPPAGASGPVGLGAPLPAAAPRQPITALETAAKAAAAAKTVAAAAETTVVTVAVEPTFTLEEFCKDGDHVVHKISPLSNTSETSGVFAVKELPQGCIIPSPPRSRELKQSQKKTTRAAAKELVGHNFITVRIGCEEETFDTSELLNVPNVANSCLPAPYNEPNCEWTVVKVKLEDGSVVAGLGLHTTASTAAGTELLLGNGGGGVLASKRNPFQPSIPLRESTVEGTCPICSREGLCG